MPQESTLQLSLTDSSLAMVVLVVGGGGDWGAAQVMSESGGGNMGTVVFVLSVRAHVHAYVRPMLNDA